MPHTVGVVCTEGVRLLLKRPWDPAAFNTAEPPRLKTLPYDATLILTPARPANNRMPGAGRKTRRALNWRRMWSELFANVIEIEPPNAVAPALAARPSGDDDMGEDANQDWGVDGQVHQDKGNDTERLSL